jgi:hypothetical protein
MKVIIFLHSILLLALLNVHSQENVNSMVVVSYNVENLFDTINSPGFDDDEFTPTGGKMWNSERYEKKLQDLARVISSVPGNELPAIVGLAEVENRLVVEDLIGTTALQEADYQIIHEDGNDPRGIECALLFRKAYFSYVAHEYIPIEDPMDPEYLYRDILYVTGRGPDGALLHLFMNHWKSRSGGVAETEIKRMFSASTIQKKLVRLKTVDPDCRLVIMGDFNDEPSNRSISGSLMALNKRRNLYPGELYNLHYDLHNIRGEGTYAYRGQWNMLDQIIVSYNLLNQEKGLSCGFESGKILREDWMLYISEKYDDMLPSSTYGGPEYYGGPADHLPVYVSFSLDGI